MGMGMDRLWSCGAHESRAVSGRRKGGVNPSPAGSRMGLLGFLGAKFWPQLGRPSPGNMEPGLAE